MRAAERCSKAGTGRQQSAGSGGSIKGWAFWSFLDDGQVAPQAEGGGSGLYGIRSSDSTFSIIRQNAASLKRCIRSLSPSQALAPYVSQAAKVVRRKKVTQGDGVFLSATLTVLPGSLHFIFWAIYRCDRHRCDRHCPSLFIQVPHGRKCCMFLVQPAARRRVSRSLLTMEVRFPKWGMKMSVRRQGGIRRGVGCNGSMWRRGKVVQPGICRSRVPLRGKT